MTKEQLLSRLAISVRKKQVATAEVQKALLAAVDRGCSLAEIGERMGIDRQTVRWHITKAREAQETQGPNGK